MGKKKSSDNAICRNRKARHRFQILQEYECGIVLRGTEVKSLRERNCSLDESYARLERGELWLVGFHINPYEQAGTANHEPMRRRKLLLHAREINKIRPKIEQRGLTLVPLRVYFNTRGLAKITIALAQGKTHGDKRQDQKTREHRREMDRAMRKGASPFSGRRR